MTRNPRRTNALLLLTFVAMLLPVPAVSAKQEQRMRGRVVDSLSGRGLEAAQVVLLPSKNATLTDADGAFTIRVPEGASQQLFVQRLGYATRTEDLPLEADSLVLALEPQPSEMAGITVVGAGAGSLARFPGAVAVIDSAELRATRPLSGNETFKLLPGVHVQDEEGLGFRANIGIRGLDPDRSRTLLVLEDGVPVALNPYSEPEMYYSPPIERMARVELVKGSGSVLFGPQTIGGVLNYVTADPPATPEGRLEMVGGRGTSAIGQLSYGGTWNGAGVRFGALRRQTDDIRGLHFDQSDVTGKTTIPLGDRDVLGLKVGVYDESSNSTYVGLTDSLFRADPRSYPGSDDRLIVRRYSASLAHERKLRDASSIRTVAYAYQTARDWSRQNYGYNSTGNAIVFQNSTGNRNRNFEVVGIEPRARLRQGFGELEAGLRVHFERAFDQHVDGGTATARSGAIRDDEVREGRAVAAFAQQRIDLASRLRITPGLRAEYFTYERHILRTRVRREVLDEEGNVIGTVRRPEDVDLKSGDHVLALIPGLGVSWFAGSRATLFAGAHRGFAPPRAKDALIYDDDVLPVDQQPGDPVSLDLDAEKSWNMEVGMRTNPSPPVSFDATAFYLDFTNQIVEPSLSAGSVSQAALANQGATRHRGVETAAGVDWGALTGGGVSLRTDLRYTYSDARFSRDRLLAVAAGDTVNVNGNRLPYAPVHLLSLSSTATMPAGVTLKVDGVRVSEQFADNFETRDPTPNGRNGVIPAHTVWNATASFRIPGTHVTAVTAVKNVANNVYIASRRPEGIKPGLPRFVTAGFVWDF
ncbi:MAG: TonB-dependent receptor domain-containing protein [bacterium]